MFINIWPFESLFSHISSINYGAIYHVIKHNVSFNHNQLKSLHFGAHGEDHYKHYYFVYQ